MVMGVNRLVAAWSAIERPLVCAVTGHAIAGGLVLALCGDYRVGATEGKLGLTEVAVGVPFPAGAMAVVRVGACSRGRAPAHARRRASSTPHERSSSACSTSSPPRRMS